MPCHLSHHTSTPNFETLLYWEINGFSLRERSTHGESEVQKNLKLGNEIDMGFEFKLNHNQIGFLPKI